MSFPSASGAWEDPPPPGTLDDQQNSRSCKDKSHGKSTKDNYRRYSRSRSRSRSISHSRSRSREYHSRRYSHHRSRSRRHYSRRRRNHYKSRNKYSRSRSRSPSRSRHRRRSNSRSHSRSRHTRSRSRSWSSSSYSDREVYRNRSKNYVPEVPKTQEYIRKVYSKHNSAEVTIQENSFKNDGSFLEMFKKMQEEKEAEEKKSEATEAATSDTKKTFPIFGKRRGGKVLKTGVVEKLKNPSEIEEEPKDAWSVYMKEVRRYKEACCDDDSKTRPLVK